MFQGAWAGERSGEWGMWEMCESTNILPPMDVTGDPHLTVVTVSASPRDAMQLSAVATFMCMRALYFFIFFLFYFFYLVT
jgi:hypothetical protein